MQASFLLYLIFVYSHTILAERPSHAAFSLTVDEIEGQGASERRSYNVSVLAPDESNSSGLDDVLPGAGCQQEQALVKALRDLRVQNISDVRKCSSGKGCVTWTGCSVTGIALRGEDLRPATSTNSHFMLSSSFRHLPDLLTLHLHSGWIKGNLNVLNNCSKLQDLRLRETSIKGDLQSLKHCTQLQRLELGKKTTNTGKKSRDRMIIKGDLSSVSSCSSLKVLNLADTRIKGDLSSLTKLKELEHLNLEKTPIGGHLKTLRNFTNIERLDLSFTDIEGELLDLQKWRALKELDLPKTKVTGSLEDLNHAAELQVLNLAATGVVGDVAELAAMKKLRQLDLRNTRVVGELESLQDLTELDLNSVRNYFEGTQVKVTCKQEAALANVLRTLNFDNLVDLHQIDGVTWNRCRVTHISVDSFPDYGVDHRCWGKSYQHHSLSSSFKQLPDLLHLHLLDAPMNGNLDVLEKCTKLEVLSLPNSCFRGNLNSLKHLTQLRRLNLKSERAEISGDLQSLRNCTKLKGLALPHGIMGNLKALHHASDLQVLDLDRTQVSGDVADLAVAPNLSRLNLRGTKVAGELYSLRSPAKLRMAEVEISGSGIRGCVQDFALRAVLAGLGLKDSELKDLRAIDGVKWCECEVIKIKLGDRSELHGQLSQWLRRLTKLKTLILHSANVTGTLQVLKHLPMRRVDLSGTQVSGDIALILNWQSLEQLDLSNTQVAGELINHKREFFGKRLRTLKLANTNVSFMLNRYTWTWSCQKLVLLDLSRSPIESTMDRFLWTLGKCGSLGTLKLVACNLTGTIPDIARRPLADSLVTFDASFNHLSQVEAIPPRCQTFSVSGNDGIGFVSGVLKKGLADHVSLDLRHLSLAGQSEAAKELFDLKLVQKTKHRILIDKERGYACSDIANHRFAISPDKFAPHELCACLSGWSGNGTSCRQCPVNYFKEDEEGECKPCPAGSTAPKGSTTRDECKCKVGDLFNTTGPWKCGCPPEQALFGDSCRKCDELRLSCPSPCTDALLAHPLAGYVRLGNRSRAFKCIFPSTRCTVSAINASICNDGYMGNMCMECRPGFYSSGKLCKQCTEVSSSLTFQNFWKTSAVAVAVVAVVAAVVLTLLVVWMRRFSQNAQSDRPTSLTTLKSQLKTQLPLLLQMGQLWSVLAILAASQSAFSGFDGELSSTNMFKRAADTFDPRNTWDFSTSSTFWEVPYVQVVQLSFSNLKEAFNLQCKFDGAMVRLAFALASALFPLLVLLCCSVLEIISRGTGVAIALQALTILYIGGASSCADLFVCQDIDGSGESLPKEFAFRKSLPHIECQNSSPVKTLVDVVAYVGAFCYGVVIPLSLLYVYARQHMILKSSRMTVACASHGDNLKVYLYKLRECTFAKVPHQDDRSTRCLVASAAAYIAVLFHGRASVWLVEGAIMVKPSTHPTEHLAFDVDLLDLLGPEDAQEQAKTLKCRSIAEMLTERVILQDVIHADRVLLGAKQLLLKYMLCKHLWMEIAQKLVAVALVSSVNSVDSLQFSVGITLTMAATSLMVQPYLQQQVNTLQCWCFICLALAAISFKFQCPWSSRAALLFPFALSAFQALRPDNVESLAIRIWEELDRKMKALKNGQSVEVTADIFSFI